MTGEVSPAEPARRPVASSELRASHEDRDGVVEQLRVAAGDGRLTSEELDERLELALNARTYAQLAALIADLPAGPGQGTLAGAGPHPEPKELVRIQCGSGSAKRDGKWMVPQRMEVAVTSGHVKLDFTQAVITGRSLLIDANVRSGSIILITRPGIVLHSNDVTVNSGSVKERLPWGHDVPEILRVEVSGRVRSGSIVARPPRRTFWQWLTRAPRPYMT
jgi:hypothetical protein